MFKSRISTFAVLLLLLAGARASNSVADDRELSQQFFNTYCVSCHGQQSPKAGLRLDHVGQAQWNDPVTWPLFAGGLLLAAMILPGVTAYRRRQNQTVR